MASYTSGCVVIDDRKALPRISLPMVLYSGIVHVAANRARTDEGCLSRSCSGRSEGSPRWPVERGPEPGLPSVGKEDDGAGRHLGRGAHRIVRQKSHVRRLLRPSDAPLWSWWVPPCRGRSYRPCAPVVPLRGAVFPLPPHDAGPRARPRPPLVPGRALLFADRTPACGVVPFGPADLLETLPQSAR